MSFSKRLDGKNILFVSVRFFGYEDAIAKTLREMGATVDFYDDRPTNSLLGKALIRVNKSLSGIKIRSYYHQIQKEITNKKYEYFLLIKGEAIPNFFIEFVRKNNPGIRMIYYAYDSFCECPKTPYFLSLFDKVFTFDSEDARKYGFGFRPSFYLETFLPATEVIPVEYDLCFIGTVHSDRSKTGAKVQEECRRKKLTSYFYYYAHHPVLFSLRQLWDKNLRNLRKEDVYYKTLSHSEVRTVYDKSCAVLDINKPYQHGLSIRTFDVLTLGKKLVTTNQTIKKYPFYSEDSILVISRENPVIPKSFIQKKTVPLSEEIREKLSIRSWAECIFFEDTDPYWSEVCQ